MNAQQEAAISTLKNLIETARDGQEGFRKAAEYIVDDPELKMLLSSLSLQRAKFAGELEAEAISMGESFPETGTSVASSLHRWWMDMRAALSKDDNHAILDECERGEDKAVHAYHSALEHELPHPIKEMLHRQLREVAAAHNTIRALRDATPGSASKLMAAAKERSDRAAHEAHLAWERAKLKASDAIDTAKDKLSRDGEVHKTIKENPLLLLGGAILGGLALGMLFRWMERRRASEHYPQEMLAHRAKKMQAKMQKKLHSMGSSAKNRWKPSLGKRMKWAMHDAIW